MIGRIIRGLGRRVNQLVIQRFKHDPRVINSSVTHPHLIDSTARIIQSVLRGPVTLNEYVRVLEGSVTLVGNVTIERYAVLNGPDTDIFSAIHPVTIGAFTSIARHVSVQEYFHDISTCSTYFIQRQLLGAARSEVVSKGPVIIGNDVWIGAHSIVLSGVTIGDGAVIGANSVVTHDIPPYAVAAGSPARILRYRFDDEIIARLLVLRWWEWPVERIRRNAMLFIGPLTSEKIDAIVE